MIEVTLPIAFIFGLISFVSPCVLPLVPAYISYMGGRMFHNADSGVLVGVGAGTDRQTLTGRPASARFALFLHGLAFVMGFTLVFVLLGVVTTALVREIGGQNISSFTAMISRLGGVLIVFFGLHFSGLLPQVFRRLCAVADARVHAAVIAALTIGGALVLVWGFAGRLDIWQRQISQPVWPDALGLLTAAVFVLLLTLGGAFQTPRAFIAKLSNTVELALYSDTRRQMSADSAGGLTGSLLMGVVFSAGWSPCIGVVYGAILTVSAQTGNVAAAAMQLAAYSFGLGVPFLISALALDSVQVLFRKINRRMKTIKLVSGLLLVLVGVLMLTGEMQRWSRELATAEFNHFSLELEERALDALVGQPSVEP